MTRRTGFTLLGIAVVIFLCCAGLIGYRLVSRHAAPSPPTAVAPETEAPPAEPVAHGPTSTIIDLPGDPVLVRRGATTAPKPVDAALPIVLAANAPKVQSAAFFVGSPLVSINGGFMGKFPEVAEGAEVADAGLLNESLQISVDSSAALDAGSDDDGGATTPASAQQAMVTDLNSSQLDVSVGGVGAQPQIKEALIKVVVQEKISDLLIRNGFTEESARAIEAAAKAIYNIQSLPPSTAAIAEGALDTSGAYRVTQLSIYQNKEYVGAVALAEAGGYGQGAQPSLPPGLLDEDSKDVDMAVHYNLADGIYSAGVRNNIPEPVIREAIQLLGKLTDLKASLPAEENFRMLYSKDFRGKSKLSGKVIYIGLNGPGGPIDCYSFQAPQGGFRCFDPKGGVSVPTLSTGPAPTSVGGIFAPIKGAPVTSTFGMRFHPILHILRLHAGIDFGAPIGSQVRAVADGKVEIAGPVQGFGNHVRLQHKGFETSYSHLSEIPANVTVGASVTQGQIIALSGNTGLSTGPHLHFEYYLDRVAVDPLPHMGTEVPGSGPASPAISTGPSEQELAAFAADKALVDAALESAIH
jgi:murein DD-endopeptidase MepM/ murein hydrolase activator NlpD